ncbi:sulfurtransferase TusA family protein [Clostridium sp. Marseille-Q2269]|uniref:sulfurtransferase TusA family protein n=1 Tax=Clostridium sp. Marseille-Q2269 TaxID=2942205 RepID=UPI002073B565|nr:sulfurtransferase TusA family protein [Clostridium sp. Marseille-Q2269]
MSVKEVDCLYDACPIPVLKAMKELKKMNQDDILILYCDHSCVVISLEEWAEQNKYSVKSVETEDGQWEVYIQKSK